MSDQGIPFHRHIISLICMAIISGGLVFYFQKPSLASYSTSQSSDELEKIHQLYTKIQNEYYQEVNSDLLIEGALKGMTDSLADPYTSYLNQEAAASFTTSLSGEFEGIGATLQLVDDLPEVAQSPVKNSPAEKSGLRVHDQILQVDGRITKGLPLSEIVSFIRGEKGTSVQLQIKRADEIFDVAVVRDVIPVYSVYGQLASENSTIGQIEIVNFSQNTALELKEMIEELRKEGATSWLIDLRQNPGGYLDQVEKMASMFLEDGEKIVQFSLKNQILGEVVASQKLDQGFKVQEPVVVLVDGGSASASEIFAAALKESANVPIVGTTTYGKGTVQSVSSFQDQSELKLTVQKWLTPSGNWLHETGLEPDIVIDFPEYAYLIPLSKKQTLKLNDELAEISTLNQFLQALGYLTTVENSYSLVTKQAVEQFQMDNQLEVTGEVDQETASLIEIRLSQHLKKTDPMRQKALETLTEMIQ
ncbi:S41 family peptidase [Enterococcus lemanii]|uniref:S41 family peptidase n=1 Tax=Enterococcus lemanii TaxID=1159752 RepID=A0ABV9MY29_9ENTE|nr:S41 family peptidase [Enterococcus lemanii]MBM7709968.1 carboxyl-terminal processing protease [Enterococcus lemanii]